MKFTTFLKTEINGVLPIDKLKTDLQHFKSTFNYATKTQDLYNNLIDNIMFILQSKYGRFDIIFREVSVMYNELLLTLSPQIPQFLMIQKKQLLESLDTFASLNNWGDVLKDNIKRDLNLTASGENKTNYIPIDGTEKDPYSSNDVSSIETQGEETNVSRNTSDYLDFYSRIRWNIADLELEKILQPYIKLFKVYHSILDFSGDAAITNDIEVRVERLEKADEEIRTSIVELGGEIDKTNENVASNLEQINNLEESKANKSDVYTKQEVDLKETALRQEITGIEDALGVTEEAVRTNTQSITTINNEIDQIEQELNTFAKKGLENTFTAKNTFNSEVIVQTPVNDFNPVTKKYLRENSLSTDALANYYTKTEVDGLISNRLSNYYTKSESDNRYVQFTLSKPLNANYQSLYNLSNPNNSRDAATKEYVDNWSYSKSVSNSRYILKGSVIKLKTFKLNECRWVAGGVLGGRWDIWQFPNSVTSTMTTRCIHMGITYGAPENVAIIVSPNSKLDLQFIIKRIDSDANEVPSDAWISFYWVSDS